MKKRMGFYVSGSASRIFSFYQKYSVSDYPFVFIFYDGENDQVEQRLIETFGNKVFIFKNAEKSIRINRPVILGFDSSNCIHGQW